MAYDFRLPQMSIEEQPEQALKRMQKYLFQLSQQLQIAMDGVEGTAQQAVVSSQSAARAAQNAVNKNQAATFAQIKDLIIKSADLIEVISTKVQTTLDGKYVAVSEFGTFQQLTEQKLTLTDKNITQQYNNFQQILSNMQGISDMMIDVTAYIRTGQLFEEDGVPRYGVEIGEQAEIDGVQTFRKFARLVSDRLSFYDANGIEVAYISDRTLYIGEAEVQLMKAKTIEVRVLHLGDYTITAGNDGHLTIL